MALNPASHNAAGVKTGPVTDPPPQASSETTSAILGAAENDPMGQHEGGQSGGEKKAQERIESMKEASNGEGAQEGGTGG